LNCDWVLTTCPFCGVGCNFYLETLDGEITDVVPCKTHEVSEGELCVLGRNAWKFVQHPDRLKTPLIQKNGRLEEATWDEALDLVVRRLGEIKRQYGSDALGVLSSAKCTNEENFLLMKFARAVLGTNNVDHCARLCHASTVSGLTASFGSAAMTNSIPEIAMTDCMLVTGSNTTEQHPIIGGKIIKAKERGAKLIVVDPRVIPLAEVADIYLRPKPGTNVAWLNGFMNVLITEGLLNEEFISQRTEGFDQFKKIVEKYPPKQVEEISGIPKDQLREAAILFGKSKKAMIFYAMGITQHTTGTDGVKSIANLAMLTGNVGREGTGVCPLRGQNNVQGACDMGALPNLFSGYQQIENEDARKKFETAWGVSLPSKPGLTLVEMINAACEGHIKGMFIMGENPMLSDPDINHVREGLEALDLLVVQEIFLSETAKLADVVLPGVSFAEKEGTFTATDRKVQRVRKAIEPVGGSLPDWMIICRLAQKMGGNGFSYQFPSEIMQEIARLTPSYGGISYERLDRGEVLAWPCPTQDHPGTKFLHQKGFTRGKGLFSPVRYLNPAEIQDKKYPYLLTTGRVAFQFHTGTMTRRIPDLNNEAPSCFIEINPQDAEGLKAQSGDILAVESRRGAIEVQALITDRVSQGTVFIPFHFAEAAANMLTSRFLDPAAKIPEFKVCAVAIHKKEN
jgi:formate dehydrogenase (NADP+) alpha subunit